jgi:hypothetical protein
VVLDLAGHHVARATSKLMPTVADAFDLIINRRAPLNG